MAAAVDAYLVQRSALLADAVPGSVAARELSDLTDSAVRALAQTALSRLGSRWAVLALGGWGAGRLLPHSDLDILVLTDTRASDLKPALADMLYPLWDAGLTVGHQVRAPRDHVRAAREDVQVLTATLTGRHLCGDESVSAGALDSVAAYARRHSGALVRELSARKRTGSPYLLEPDLKNGQGGQRDLDELVWTGAALCGRPSADIGAALEAGLLGESEAAALACAGDAVTEARWALHRLSTRATSLLTIESGAECCQDLERLQGALATIHHTLLRVRARVRGEATRFDPRCGDLVPLDAEALFALLDRGEDALPDMEEAAWSGLFDDLVPAFSELMAVRRPALSHLYTVGSHSVRTAALVASHVSADPREAHGAAPGRALQVAALLHDLGKTQRGPGHAERGELAVRTLASRFGLADAQMERAAMLVREHLLLSETAGMHDIHDEDVILRIVDRVASVSALDDLRRLTVADSLATGPGAWSSWHEALTGELVDRLRTALESGPDAVGLAGRAEETRSEALQRLAMAHETTPAREFLARAPLRYLASNDAAAVAADAGLVADIACCGMPDAARISVTPGPAEGTWRVALAAADRAGLFARACGAFSLTGLDIMAADAYDAGDHIALDLFVVRPDTRSLPDTATWSALERHIRTALTDLRGLDARLAERRRHYALGDGGATRVEFGATAAYATEVRVRTSDRLGLLYDIARAMADCDLRIIWARAVTQDGTARDTFHVTDANGAPVEDPGLLGHIAMRIRERL